MIYSDFADLIGNYEKTVEFIQAKMIGPCLVRTDSFSRNGKEIHRVYLTNSDQYEKLKEFDNFPFVRKS